MLTNYMIHAMTKEDFNNYMSGSWNYRIIKLSVLAENEIEALAVAELEHPDLIIQSYVKTMKEVLEEKAEAEKAAIVNEERKKENERIKAIQLAAKAQAIGLAVEEYNEYKKARANKNRHANELKKAKAMIQEMERKIKYEEKKIAEYEEKMKKYENRA